MKKKENSQEEVEKIQKGQKQINKNSRGITLIALVITIIVLIILAGVSINLVLGDNGIFNKARTSGLEMEKAKFIEDAGLAYSELYMEMVENTEFSTITMARLKTKLIVSYGYEEKIKTVVTNDASDITLSETNIEIEANYKKVINVQIGDGSGEVNYVLIQGKYYPINLTNSGINLGEGLSELPQSGESSKTLNITSSNSIVSVTTDNTNIITISAGDKAGNETITVTYGDNITKTINVTVKANKGNIVDLGKVTVGENELKNDWQYFYEDNQNIYLIYADYLENEVIPDGEGMSKNEYNVWSSSGDDTNLMNYLKGEDSHATAWNGIKQAIEGALEAKNIETTVKVVGGPDLELFQKALNSMYKDLKFEAKEFELGEENPDGDTIQQKGWAYRLGGIGGYKYEVSIEKDEKMFFPHKERVGTTAGYWLVGDSAHVGNENKPRYCSVEYENKVGYAHSNINVGVRPVVTIEKTDDLIQALNLVK